MPRQSETDPKAAPSSPDPQVLAELRSLLKAATDRVFAEREAREKLNRQLLCALKDGRSTADIRAQIAAIDAKVAGLIRKRSDAEMTAEQARQKALLARLDALIEAGCKEMAASFERLRVFKMNKESHNG